MRLQFVSSGLGVGGAERFLALLTGKLQKQGFEIAVLGLQGGRVLEELRVAGIRADAPELGWATGVLGLAAAHRHIRNFAPDIVQGWMYHGCIAATLLRGPARLAWSIRQSSDPSSLNGRSTRAAHRIALGLSGRPLAIIYNSVHARKTHEQAGFAPERGVVIANGVERLSVADRRVARRGLGLPTDAFMIGHVARWHPVKDHETLLRAFGSFARSAQNARLMLVGEGMDASNQTLCTLIEREGVREAVALLGHRRNLDQVYSSMDVACLSSRSEAFPNVLAEAMAAGVPCVSTEVGDVASLLGDTGRLVPPGDVTGLTKAFLDFERMPAEQREKMGEAAQARVLQHFSIDAAAHAYAQLYQRLAAK